MAQGMGGMMALTGMRDGPPTRVGVAVSDIFTGVYSVIGILAAVEQRHKTGKGAYVDTALVDSTVGVLANNVMNYLVSGKIPERLGNAHANIVPYQEFPAADGFLIVATGNDRQYQDFCKVIGAPELGTDPNYIDNTSRLKHRTELVGKLTELTKKMKRDDLLAKLEAVKVPAGPINNLEQVFADKQVQHRGMKLELKSEAAKGGIIPGVRSPIVIDGWKAASEKPSPRLGEHTQEILREIGEG
jgi:crotonobetainyl-CoA:carnitine CoA-transferase CaiB-like acyl-CoA transferase